MAAGLESLNITPTRRQRVFQWVLIVLGKSGLVKGRPVGIDATTLVANAAMKSIVRRDTGQSYEEFLTELARHAGIEEPTKEDLAKLDRKRKKKGSNQDWQNPHDPDAKITKQVRIDPMPFFTQATKRLGCIVRNRILLGSCFLQDHSLQDADRLVRAGAHFLKRPDGPLPDKPLRITYQGQDVVNRILCATPHDHDRSRRFPTDDVAWILQEGTKQRQRFRTDLSNGTDRFIEWRCFCAQKPNPLLQTLAVIAQWQVHFGRLYASPPHFPLALFDQPLKLIAVLDPRGLADVFSQNLQRVHRIAKRFDKRPLGQGSRAGVCIRVLGEGLLQDCLGFFPFAFSGHCAGVPPK